jgi:hypothetical protein
MVHIIAATALRIDDQDTFESRIEGTDVYLWGELPEVTDEIRRRMVHDFHVDPISGIEVTERDGARTIRIVNTIIASGKGFGVEHRL